MYIFDTVINGSSTSVSPGAATFQQVLLVVDLGEAGRYIDSPTNRVLLDEFPDLPQIGSIHPIRSEYILEAVTAVPVADAKDQAKIVGTYRNICCIFINLSCTVVRETTRLDVNGNITRVNYASQQSADFDATSAGAGVPAVADVPIYRPYQVLEFEYYRKDLSRKPTEIRVGAVNSDTWMDSEPYTWLCVSDTIRGVPNPVSGATGSVVVPDPNRTKMLYWKCHVAFQRRGLCLPQQKIRQTWKELAIWRDPLSPNIVPQNINPAQGIANGQTKGNGWAFFDVYPGREYKVLFSELPSQWPEQ